MLLNVLKILKDFCGTARVNENASWDFLEYKNSGVANVEKVYYEAIK